MKHIFYILTVLFFFTISACYWDKEELLNPVKEEVCDSSNISFSGQISDILNSNCIMCHGNSVYTTAGAGINLDGYSNILTYAENGKLWGTVNHDTGFSPMPKNGGKLNNCNITIIETWINSGYPNN